MDVYQRKTVNRGRLLVKWWRDETGDGSRLQEQTLQAQNIGEREHSIGALNSIGKSSRQLYFKRIKAQSIVNAQRQT